MARGFGYDVPDEWDSGEQRIWDSLVAGDEWMGGDPELQDMFDAAFLDPNLSTEQRNEAYEALIDYMWDEYGVDFEDVFDWDDYRSWYDAA